jgi:3-oxoadipate enol-lactonase
MTWTETSGVSIRYELSGAGEHSVIFVHELGGSLESWDGVVAFFADRRRVLRFDQRGAGLSEKVRQPFTLDDHARDLEAVVRASRLPPPYVLAGVAGGAAIAFLFALQHGGEVSGTILCAPSIGIAADRQEYFRNRSALAERVGMRGVIDATLAAAYPPIVVRDAGMHEAYRARFLGNDPVGYGLCNRALADSHLEHLAESLACPCLVLAGTHDPLRPPARAQELASRIPDAEFEVVDSGHFMHVQAPQEVAARMRAFLEKRQL